MKWAYFNNPRSPFSLSKKKKYSKKDMKCASLCLPYGFVKFMTLMCLLSGFGRDSAWARIKWLWDAAETHCAYAILRRAIQLWACRFICYFWHTIFDSCLWPWLTRGIKSYFIYLHVCHESCVFLGMHAVPWKQSIDNFSSYNFLLLLWVWIINFIWDADMDMDTIHVQHGYVDICVTMLKYYECLAPRI